MPMDLFRHARETQIEQESPLANRMRPRTLEEFAGQEHIVGPGRLLDSGERGELSVSVGDEVIYGKYGGTDIEVNGEEVKILRESDILAKVLD